jgi:OOP family OmpA-OmpF porin
MKVDANGCELDSDGDGVADSLDKCPNTPAAMKVDANGCELDSDGDGVADSLDKCPDTPKGERVDANGCPFQKDIKLEGVYFDTNKADLRPESQATLDYAVKTLQRYPELVVQVAGHTDNRGDDALNRKLSQARAESVMQYLASHGVANKLSAKGYGKSQPITSNATDAGRQQNRRVSLLIVE